MAQPVQTGTEEGEWATLFQGARSPFYRFSLLRIPGANRSRTGEKCFRRNGIVTQTP